MQFGLDFSPSSASSMNFIEVLSGVRGQVGENAASPARLFKIK
jgi:hypothetical protein